jgi:transcription initiation factor TFIIE subunit alpha
MFDDPMFQQILHEITQDDENSVLIIKCLINGRITDEEIAEEMGVRLNIVRRVLYKLYDAGLASYKRSKDPETQWYIYSWKFEKNRVFDIIEDKFKENRQHLKKTLEYEEKNMFFACGKGGCGSRYNFEDASENNFICPKCGCKLEYQDNSLIITDLKKKVC